MSKLPIRSFKGEQVGDYDLADDLLVLDRGGQAVQEAIVAYRANQRLGTASTLGKGEVAGSNKKPWRQKGTGRARAGYRQSPVWRGGGVAFGPKPRDFSKKMQKKTKGLAFAHAFSERVNAGHVDVVDALELAEPKTKELAKLVAPWLQKDLLVLVVVDSISQNLLLAARNMADVKVVGASLLNIYDVLRYPRILVTKAGMDILQKRLELCSCICGCEKEEAL